MTYNQIHDLAHFEKDGFNIKLFSKIFDKELSIKIYDRTFDKDNLIKDSQIEAINIFLNFAEYELNFIKNAVWDEYEHHMRDTDYGYGNWNPDYGLEGSYEANIEHFQIFTPNDAFNSISVAEICLCGFNEYGKLCYFFSSFVTWEIEHGVSIWVIGESSKSESEFSIYPAMNW